jgi:hypothetical protein
VGVAVDDEIRPVHSDRGGKPAGSEKRPDRLGLSDERLRNRRVVHQHHDAMTAGDGFETFLESLHLERGLTVDVAQQPFAEVGELGAGEPADEALHAHDPELDLTDLEHEVAAIEDDDVRTVQDLDQLGDTTRVVVMVPEDRDDRHRQLAARVREHKGLIGEPMRRQVPGKEHEIGRAFECRERPRDPLAKGLGTMQIARRSEADGSRHEPWIPAFAGCANAAHGYSRRMPSADTPREISELVVTMKRAAAALRDAGVPFMLGGGLAAWARGGPPTDHDVDFFVEESDAGRALEALTEAGMKPEQPPEEWLLKAHDGDVLVDIIFRPSGGAVGATHFERATEMEVLGQTLLVASIDDVLVTKLLALSEQEPDFSAVLALARALREQIDWDDVRARTEESPFARAFFTLVQGLGIVDPNRSLMRN